MPVGEVGGRKGKDEAGGGAREDGGGEGGAREKGEDEGGEGRAKWKD